MSFFMTPRTGQMKATSLTQPGLPTAKYQQRPFFEKFLKRHPYPTLTSFLLAGPASAAVMTPGRLAPQTVAVAVTSLTSPCTANRVAFTTQTLPGRMVAAALASGRLVVAAPAGKTTLTKKTEPHRTAVTGASWRQVRLIAFIPTPILRWM